MFKSFSCCVLVLQTLFLFACMLPPYRWCWDAYIIPKWYASICVVLIAVIMLCLCPQSRNVSVWKKYLPIILLPFAIDLSKFTFKESNKKNFFKKKYVIAVLTITLFLVSATNSRTGIIIIVLYMLIAICRHKWRKKVYKFIISVGLFMMVVGISFVFKNDSSFGRMFVVLRSVELIIQRPFCGYGTDGFLKEYMLNQALFFQLHPQSEYGYLADNIQHPLNEFIRLWIDYGVVGPFILLLLISLPLIVYRRNVNIVMVEVCLFVCCSLSYPLSYPLPVYTIIFLFFVTVVNLVNQTKKYVVNITCFMVVILLLWVCGLFYIDNLMSSAIYYSQRSKHNKSIEKYEKLCEYFNNNLVYAMYGLRYKFILYNMSRELYTIGSMQRAKSIIVETERLFVDYDTRLLTADIDFQLKNYSKAIEAYKAAGYMCPVRFAPLEGLLNCYKMQRNYENAYYVARLIVLKKEKVKSADVDIIKEKARCFLMSETPYN